MERKEIKLISLLIYFGLASLRVMRITKFEELKIWKLALKITKEVYDLTSKKELSKDFKLRTKLGERLFL